MSDYSLITRGKLMECQMQIEKLKATLSTIVELLEGRTADGDHLRIINRIAKAALEAADEPR